ncbi:MAG: twitching motility protein PilT [Alphaproteobacteria bacterium RIFOXYD12_FULL_60_8]|nr:MAG: twitching motility protein PilT [Alphaproteobacteria bacterium RIFOXYD12_FULL_60_8]
MKLLLDTHTFLWWVSDAPELSEAARTAITNPNNTCYVSVASGWEMSIKSSLGKLKLKKPIERFLTEQMQKNSFLLLNIELHHVTKVESLPFLHRDPFDRLLVSQAKAERMTLITADQALSAYGIRCLW